jgi:hypothetical protein
MMRSLSMTEVTLVSGGKKSKTTPVGPGKKTMPEQAAHGIETSAAASSKPKKPKKA